MNILWQGARGVSVKQLQKRLRDFGFDPGKLDGFYGPKTAAAVTAFQRDRGLFADGLAGPQTFAFLKFDMAGTKGLSLVRNKVFISYSHADERWLQMLQVHLAPLERQGLVLRWDDTKIEPGKNWRIEIADALRVAKAAVLLISANFMASEFIATNELPQLTDAASHEGAIIIPVIISPCILGKLSDLQSVNPPSKPLVDLGRGDRDRVWVKVVERITDALNA